MKKTIAAALLALTGTSLSAGASPVTLKNCKSDIVTEVFKTCRDGEGGSRTVCGSEATKHGSVFADLTIDSERQIATASLIYTPESGGAPVKSKTACAVDQDHWMNCESFKPVPELGRLTISFNINGIAPGVYFADIFADVSNAPVGGFQNTEMACD